jgi:hypothetical protein
MRRRKRRRRLVGTNVVTETVERLGGVIPTAAVAGVVPETVYRAMKVAHFTSAAAVVRVVRVVEPDDVAAQMKLAAKLAGLPE